MMSLIGFILGGLSFYTFETKHLFLSALFVAWLVILLFIEIARSTR